MTSRSWGQLQRLPGFSAGVVCLLQARFSVDVFYLHHAAFLAAVRRALNRLPAMTAAGMLLPVHFMQERGGLLGDALAVSTNSRIICTVYVVYDGVHWCGCFPLPSLSYTADHAALFMMDREYEEDGNWSGHLPWHHEFLLQGYCAGPDCVYEF